MIIEKKKKKSHTHHTIVTCGTISLRSGTKTTPNAQGDGNALHSVALPYYQCNYKKKVLKARREESSPPLRTFTELSSSRCPMGAMKGVGFRSLYIFRNQAVHFNRQGSLCVSAISSNLQSCSDKLEHFHELIFYTLSLP